MVIIKVPARNGLGMTDGVERAPDAIIDRLQKEVFLSEGGIKPRFSILSVAVDGGDIEETNRRIEECVSQADERPVIIGGDHSITYPCFKAFSKRFKNPGILVFDAHPDMVNTFVPPTHEDYLRVLIEERIVAPQNVVLVGLRSWDETERVYLAQKRIKTYPMREIAAEGLGDMSDSFMAAVKDWGAVYVSIDIDVIDPAFAPGTGYIEPGGLSSREFLYVLARLKNLRNLQAFDLVEVNPLKDVNGMTVKLGAKIVAELL